ncbi:MAG: hypothetical protein CL920_25990 [Deltaproteobacteria bacterium]|nr:hypothetical protein [Deltaproteobacteria bacterium]
MVCLWGVQGLDRGCVVFEHCLRVWFGDSVVFVNCYLLYHVLVWVLLVGEIDLLLDIMGEREYDMGFVLILHGAR